MSRRKPARIPAEKSASDSLRKKKGRATCATKRHRRQAANGLRPLSVVDHVQRESDNKLTLPVRIERFYECREDISSLRRVEPKSRVYHQIGIYSSNELCLRQTSSATAALNKWSRWFGRISRNRHFRFVLRCFTVAGCTNHDFRSLMRIRDLSTRGLNREFKKRIIQFSFKFPSEVREEASVLT